MPVQISQLPTAFSISANELIQKDGQIFADKNGNPYD